MNNPRRVVIAMSGGVDSSVASALLLQQGYQVIGMMMRLWSESGREEENRCCTPNAMVMARRVAAILDIPFYVVDAQQAFHEVVVQQFIDGYAQGYTPNPCLACNRLIRWDFLLHHAMALGAQFMATGHYARLHNDEYGLYQILRGVDQQKDQSYVLHMLDQNQLSHTLLPLGEYLKPQVRQIAHQLGLPVADRAESQDLCFLGDEDYRSFLLRNAPLVKKPGPILTSQGQFLGQHQGLAFYTIGQRKGLGITSTYPLYVLAKDIQRNTLIVGHEEELGAQELVAKDINWISGDTPEISFTAQVKIRYKAHEVPGTITPLIGNRVHIHFDQTVRDITPGQAAVFYNSEVCLGGGTIC